MNNITNNVINYDNKTPEYAYHLLRGSLEAYSKNPTELDSTQYQQVLSMADKTYSLESRVLSTTEAASLQIEESDLDAAFYQVAKRYSSPQLFIKDLSDNDLNEEVLRSALNRELLFDAVMNKVIADIPEVDDADAQVFYNENIQRFTIQEKRKSRHILITINPDFSDGDRNSARMRIDAILKSLKLQPETFMASAKKYSECPTALEGGDLGEIVAGTLYAELNEELFNMQQGEVSKVVETEMGFHILLCEKIIKPTTQSFLLAKKQIKYIIHEKNKKQHQLNWLKQLANNSQSSNNI